MKDGETETEREDVHKTHWFSHFNIYIILHVVLSNASCSYLTWFNKYLELFITRPQPAPISWRNRYTRPAGRERMLHHFTKLEKKTKADENILANLVLEGIFVLINLD